MVRIRRSDNVQPVYSTEDGRIPPERPAPGSRGRSTAPVRPGVPDDGIVRVSRTSSGRGGKTVTLVTGVPAGDLERVASRLKKRCGTGGTVKNGVIEIQGDHRTVIVEQLSGSYRTKLAGG